MYGERRSSGGFRGGYGGGGMSTPPVKVGEELDVTIEAVGEKGDGLVKKNGFVLFVPGVKEGQQVKIRVTKVLRKVGFAEVVGQGTAAPATEGESSEAPAEEAPAREAPAAEAPESSEDSESFGEEAPAEESTEESSEETSDEQ
jgi:predicted RNA-binding protein with TRAM domain